jgi:tetratricopeptide (TPR) repeat protein/transcriptional regulator with XRE-family HTH domain
MRIGEGRSVGGRALEPLRLPAGFWAKREVGDALASRAVGALFRLVAKYAGASQTQLAIAVGMTQGQVSTIMAGSRRVTAIEVAERLFDGLDAPDTARIAFGLAPRRLSSIAGNAGVPASGSDAEPLLHRPNSGGDPVRQSGSVAADSVVLRVAIEGREVAVPLSRRFLMQAGLGALAEALSLGRQVDGLRALVDQSYQAERLTITSPAHLHEVLAYLRDQWHVLVKTDNLLGPRFALAGVLNQINVIEALLPALRDGSRLGAVGLGAQYAESAAWLYEDSGNLDRARHWTSRAMEWAYEAGDKRMVAWTVFRRSQQAATAGDPAQVIGLAQAARRDEAELGSPMRSAIRVQEAFGYALDGDELTAQQLLDEAHTWAASDSAGDARGGHGSYCTASYIEIQRAGCWLAVGKPKLAISLYERALPELPAVYQRDRAAALSQLARAYSADGQVEQAAATARTALPVARAAGSSRIVGTIARTGADLVPHNQLPAVAALLDELAVGAA